jgi:hypothetical protein
MSWAGHTGSKNRPRFQRAFMAPTVLAWALHTTKLSSSAAINAITQAKAEVFALYVNRSGQPL